MVITIFAILASFMAVCVYVQYLRQVMNSSSTPNPATLFIWTAASIMNAATYFFVVSGDLRRSLIAIVTAFLATAVFLYSLYKGKLTKLGRVEVAALIGAVLAGVLWKATGDATLSNLFMQVIIAISFLPVIIGLLKETLRENPLAWTFAVIAYVFATTVVIMEYDGKVASLAYPVVNGIIGNGSVALIAFLKRPRPMDG